MDIKFTKNGLIDMKTFSDLPAFLREKADIIESNLKKGEFEQFTDLAERQAVERFFSLMADSFING